MTRLPLFLAIPCCNEAASLPGLTGRKLIARTPDYSFRQPRSLPKAGA